MKDLIKRFKHWFFAHSIVINVGDEDHQHWVCIECEGGESSEAVIL